MSDQLLLLGALITYVLFVYATHRLDSADKTTLDFTNMKFRKADEPGMWHVTIKPFAPKSSDKTATISIYRNGACIGHANASVLPDVIVADGPFIVACVPTTRLSASIPLAIDPRHPPPGTYIVRITEHYFPGGATCTDWRKEINTEIRSQ